MQSFKDVITEMLQDTKIETIKEMANMTNQAILTILGTGAGLVREVSFEGGPAGAAGLEGLLPDEAGLATVTMDDLTITGLQSDVQELILRGFAPERLSCDMDLVFCDIGGLRLPRELRCRSLRLERCSQMRLPEVLTTERLTIEGCDIKALPAMLAPLAALTIRDCQQLQALPEGLNAAALTLQRCPALSGLPEGVQTFFLTLEGNTGLASWPQTGVFGGGHLTIHHCPGLSSLPDWIGRVARLDLRGCEQITGLPKGLKISGWLDLANSGITALPHHAEAMLRWNTVQIEHRIAFMPESITGAEVLTTANAELRRVKLERMGYERFIREVEPKVLDLDVDPGGPRQLLRVELPDDEALVVLWVICPSTGRNYLLRVPPTIERCRQAAAWIAGFDDERDYAPLIET